MVSETIKDKFKKGMSLKSHGSYELARKIFFELIKIEPNSGKIRAALADTYWKENDFENAVLHFSIAIKLSPEWELASLGLFHCFWESGFKDEAFDEMKRFLLVADSDDYQAILKEINGN